MKLVYNETIRPIYWKNKISGPFPDSPRCGYNNAKCPKKGIILLLKKKIIGQLINLSQ